MENRKKRSRLFAAGRRKQHPLDRMEMREEEEGGGGGVGVGGTFWTDV